ncbi:MAG: WYL domain-containing protein, partial [Gemmatimonadota bacterium]|nr:WYL domain-containing protein [Gemmatimonadota bacterium]
AREVPGYETGQNKAALRRTFERDKEELRAFGIPMETVTAPDGETVGYRLQPQHFYLPYLTLRSEGAKAKPKRVDRYGYRTLTELSFEPEELAAVVDAAARMRQLGDPLLAEHAESALRKLAADLPVDAANPDPTRLVPPRPKTAPETLASLGQALEDRKHVTFDYHTMASDSSTRRSVEPFGLFFLNQHWYLVARTPGEEAAKNYRLNRMRGLQVNPARPGTRDYEIPAAFSLRDHARSKQAWQLGATDAITAVVRFPTVTGATAAARRLGEVVDRDPDSRRFRVRRTDAFARWLLSFAGDLVPVSPRELVDEYNVLVRNTLAHHSASPPPRLPASPP